MSVAKHLGRVFSLTHIMRLPIIRAHHGFHTSCQNVFSVLTPHHRPGEFFCAIERSPLCQNGMI